MATATQSLSRSYIKWRAIILAATTILSIRAGAEPFDIPFGSTTEDLKEQNIDARSSDAPYEYVLVFPDQKAEDSLAALITPSHGMCEMRWTITVDPISPSGMELRKKYLDFYNRVTQALGKADYQSPSEQGIPNDDDWRALYLQERSFLAAWEKARNSEGDVTSLRLEASSRHAGSGIIQMTVSAPYIDECLAEQKQAIIR